MTTNAETKSKRTRRAEPITRRNAKNGAVTYTFQVDMALDLTARVRGSVLLSRRLLKLDVSTGESRLRSRQEHSSRGTERPLPNTCLYGSIVDAMCGPTPLRGTDIRSSRLSTTSVLWHCNNYGLPTSTTW